MKKLHVHIGQRILKSAVAVGACFFIYVLRGYQGIPFYSALAALQCMQPYRQNTRRIAVQRTVGTFIGALYGLLVILLQEAVLTPYAIPYGVYCCAVSLGVVAALYTAVSCHKNNAAYFSCVVFLSIVMVHIRDANPYIFVLNRVVDTLIGIAVSMGINACHLPRHKRKEVLFVAGLDDALMARTASITNYSKVELNRMLEEGLSFSIMTQRTPASFLAAAEGVNLKLPVILMDGAVLYDCGENRFLAKRELDYPTALELTRRMAELGLDVFQNAIVGDSVLIFYQALTNEADRQVYERLRKSPYRNYIQRPLPEQTPVAYLMALDRSGKVEAARDALEPLTQALGFRISCYPSDDFPGYSYLKLYHQEATKAAMLERLKEYAGFRQVVTFGSIPGAYDFCVHLTTGDELVRLLKRAFEPCLWRRGGRADSSVRPRKRLRRAP